MENASLFVQLQTYGADMKGIQNRFMGDESLYGRCFLSMLGEQNFELLRQALETQSYQDAFEAAHAMKGLTGNLGLTPLYEALCVLTESLRGGHCDNIDAEYAAVTAQLRQLSTFIA